MILLALIIACLLSRKNKYTQASTEDDGPNSRVYLKNAKKGVPVIFQDELDEKLFGAGGQGGQSRGNIYGELGELGFDSFILDVSNYDKLYLF